MKPGHITLACLAVVTVSCVAPVKVTSAQLSQDGHDPIAGMAAYRDKALHVRGVIAQKELVTRENRSVSISGFGPFKHGHLNSSVDQVPLIILDPGTMCYFEPEWLDDIAQLNVGDDVVLECEIYQFAKTNKGRSIPVLRECKVVAED